MAYLHKYICTSRQSSSPSRPSAARLTGLTANVTSCRDASRRVEASDFPGVHAVGTPRTLLPDADMIVPLTLPSGPSAGARTLPPALAQLGSSELFLLELQGNLEVSGDKRGQVVGHLTIDDNGKVSPCTLLLPPSP